MATVFPTFPRERLVLCYTGIGNKDGDIVRILDKALASAEKADELAAADAPLYDLKIKQRGIDSLLSRMLDLYQNADHPRIARLLKTPAYRAVLEKYEKK